MIKLHFIKIEKNIKFQYIIICLLKNIMAQENVVNERIF